MIYDMLTLFNDGISYAKANAWNLVCLVVCLYFLQHQGTVDPIIAFAFVCRDIQCLSSMAHVSIPRCLFLFKS